MDVPTFNALAQTLFHLYIVLPRSEVILAEGKIDCDCMPPLTVSLYCGVDVPMPTLPVEETNKLLVAFQVVPPAFTSVWPAEPEGRLLPLMPREEVFAQNPLPVPVDIQIWPEVPAEFIKNWP